MWPPCSPTTAALLLQGGFNLGFPDTVKWANFFLRTLPRLIMGLAEPKRKKKLIPSHNAPSAWSAAAPTASIGFKLMASMGWAPGKGLGNELQGEKSNIKYSLKDDLLGVGAKREIGGGVWRGMGEVDDLYRRLDVGGSPKPKAEEIVVDEVREEVSIRGGWKMNFQVGDTYKSSFSREESEVERQTSTPDSGIEVVKKVKCKKRKREGDKEEKKSKKSKKENVDHGETPIEKKSKKDMVEKLKSKQETVDQGKPAAKKSKKSIASSETVKVEKTKSKSSQDLPSETAIEELDRTAAGLTVDTQGVPPEISSKDKKAKKDKKDEKDKKGKEGKLSKKEENLERREKKSSKEKSKENDKSSKREDKRSKTKSEEPFTTVNRTTSNSLPKATVSVTETIISPSVDNEPAMPQHMHRSRFLAMKRASVMDHNALREILGVKG
jgi:Pin2-interacting protein X1